MQDNVHSQENPEEPRTRFVVSGLMKLILEKVKLVYQRPTNDFWQGQNSLRADEHGADLVTFWEFLQILLSEYVIRLENDAE